MQTAFPDRADRRFAVGLGLACLLIYNANLRGISAGDTFPARFLPLAVLHYGTLYLDPVIEAVRMGHRVAYWVLPARGGHQASMYPIVTPLLVAPLYIPTLLYLDQRGWGDLGVVQAAGAVTEKIAASCVAATCAALMFWLLRRRLSRRRALLLAAAFALGTETWVISSQALWQHGAAELLVIVALLAMTRQATTGALLAAGLASGLLIANRPLDALLAAAFAAYAPLWARPWRRSWWFFAAAAVPLALVVIYDEWCFGTLGGGYQFVGKLYQVDFFSHPVWPGIAGELVSPGKGLLVYSPFLLFLLLYLEGGLERPDRRPAVDGPGPSEARRGLASRIPTPSRWLKRSGPGGPNVRLAACLAIAVVAQLLMYAKTDWRAGRCYGPRFQTDMLPMLVWLLAPILASLSRRKLAAFAAASLFAVYVQAVGAFYYPSADSDGWMDVWKPGDAPFLTERAAGRARPLFLEMLRARW